MNTDRQDTQAGPGGAAPGGDKSPDALAGPVLASIRMHLASLYLPGLCMIIVVGWTEVFYLHADPPILRFLPLFLLAIVPILWSINWLLSRFVVRTVDVLEGGLRQGKTHLAWEAIVQVRTRAIAAVLLRGPGRKKLLLPPSLETYSVALPELVKHRPDIEIPPRIRRRMDDPGRLERIPAYTGAMILGLLLHLGLLPFAVRYGEMTMPALIAMTLFPMALLMGAIFSVGPPITRAKEFIGQTVIVAWVSCQPMVYMHSQVHPRVWDAFMAGSGMMLLAAGAAAMGAKLRPAFKAAMLAGVLLVPPAVWALEGPYVLARRELTPLLGPGPHIGSKVWSPDGRYMTDFAPIGDKDARQSVADLPAGRGYPLPPRDGLHIWGLRSGVLVRMVRSNDGNSQVMCAMALPDGPEVELATGRPVLAAPRDCVSPAGLVCWPDPPTAKGEVLLHFYDARAGLASSLRLPGPKADVGWGWSGLRWADAGHLALLGFVPSSADKDSPMTLHVIRLTRPGGKAQTRPASQPWTAAQPWISPEPLLEWQVSPDGGHAFGLRAGKNAVYVNLRTGQTLPLSGPEIPWWAADGRSAFRVAARPGRGRWLCRFDLARLQETPLRAIPEGSELVSLSPTGRYAVLHRDGFYFFPTTLVNVADGRSRLIGNFLSSFLLSAEAGSERNMGGLLSIWSPDERGVLQSDVNANGHTRLWLCEVPPDWR